MGVQQAQAAQTLRPGAGTRQLRDEDAPRLADDDHVHAPAPVDEQTDLATDGARKQGQLPRLFERIDRLLRETPVQQAVKRTCLAGFQPLQISFDPGDG